MKLKATAVLVGSLIFFASIIVAQSLITNVPRDETPTTSPVQQLTQRVNDFHGLQAIQIVRHDPENEITETTFEGLKKTVIDVDLELGESIENQMILLRPFQGDSREFKIEQQFETSMAIGDEGPHWDFVNWKHYTSEWREIKKLEDNKFLTSKVPEQDATNFPSVTPQEIYQLVTKEGNERWAALARQCNSPNDGPCYVGLSRISFRISAKDKGEWKVIHRINYSIPLGC